MSLLDHKTTSFHETDLNEIINERIRIAQSQTAEESTGKGFFVEILSSLKSKFIFGVSSIISFIMFIMAVIIAVKLLIAFCKRKARNNPQTITAPVYIPMSTSPGIHSLRK